MKNVFALFAILLVTVWSCFSQPVVPAFPVPIDPTLIPKYVDPMPHFAAGLRIDAKAGGNLLIKAKAVQQVTLSTGTPVATGGTIGDPAFPKAGMGNYLAYEIWKDGKPGIAMWPAQTIEAMNGKQLKVQYENDLYGLSYFDFNVYQQFNMAADQTLMQNGYYLNGNVLTDYYKGPIPMVTHLHGGEIPSNSDGGPTAWFMPGNILMGPGFKFDASSLCTYPNKQESPTLWYHPHDQGLTRVNVYLGLAGYYFLRQPGEDALNLPGWSGDDKVMEVTPDNTFLTPDGKTRTTTFTEKLGLGSYLPEVEFAIQDRMFNQNGELYWPVDQAPNTDVHPFWTPEFFGNVMMVNGKSWPYFSVAPRKYAFRFLDGCNARFLDLWLVDAADGITPGPKFTVISTEGGYLSTPVTINPALGQKLFLAPAERPIIIIDFTGLQGKTFTLLNDGAYPYPTGNPPDPNLDGQIMQFVVNGKMVSAANSAIAGTDKSVIPGNLRPTNPMVKLTDWQGGVDPKVKIAVKRQLLFNEITGPNGPLMVSINNSHFDAGSVLVNGVKAFGGPTEIPREGTTEMWQIINTTTDAHPMHPHLMTWQLVSRQKFDVAGYMNAWTAAFDPTIPKYPTVSYGGFPPYPGGAGSPLPYNTPNVPDGAVGGNPAVSPYLIPGTITYPKPEEQGWKDAIETFPNEVTTYLVRVAPTDVPIDAKPDKLIYSFDPSVGPGYVYHCHIIDHEDMDMMRPMMIKFAAIRNVPQMSGVASAIKDVDLNKTTYTVKGTEFDVTYKVPYGGAVTLTYSISGATKGTGGSTLAGVLLNIGVNKILWTAVNEDNLSGTFTTTVTVNKRQTIVDYIGDLREQFKKFASLKATLVDKTTNTPLAGKKITFTIGNQSVNDVTNVFGVASATLQMLQDPSKTYKVVTSFTGDAGYLGSNTSDAFDITNGNQPCTLVIPNGFSPNGDGINDYFKIICIEGYPNATLTIFNGSNKMVYMKNHYGNIDFWGTEAAALWDGTDNAYHRGAQLPMGTYIYLLDLGINDKNSLRKGTVFLTR